MTDLMDAKPKVVAWLGDNGIVVSAHEVKCDPSSEETHYKPLTPLTDHEAALASAIKATEQWRELGNQRNDELTALRAERQTLLTGLEALAGEMREEMEIFKGGVEGSWYRWRYDTFAVMEERIRTLASEAKK